MGEKAPTKTRTPLQAKYLAILRAIVDEVDSHGVKPTALAKKAHLSPSTLNRKLAGGDDSVIKPATLAAIEEAAAEILGRAPKAGEALMAELDRVNQETAGQVDDLVRTLLKKGVIEEHDLPPRLKRTLERRSYLLKLLNLPAH